MSEYDKFKMSLGRLEEQHANYRNPDASLPVLIQEATCRVGHPAIRNLL